KFYFYFFLIKMAVNPKINNYLLETVLNVLDYTLAILSIFIIIICVIWIIYFSQRLRDARKNIKYSQKLEHKINPEEEKGNITRNWFLIAIAF
ncbi:hypothetical protein, partial [Salmonella sp. s51228]|uniref:hypothetical protein n=1 Tax=Salmonella sp. s51228 TaxID=3159652 RepID=UPI0039811F95